MWAITPLSLCSPATVTTRRSNRRPFTVSAKPQKNIKYDYDSDETETDPELETLKQHVGESEPDTYVSNSESISGSVVLLALQKASAEKTSKKVKKKKKVKNIKDEDNSNNNNIKVEDYGDVKELCVKSEWKDRLDELEMQLHQLIHHT